jgi:hypothetical protein
MSMCCSDQGGLGLAGGHDDRGAVRIPRDRPQAHGNHMALTGDFDPAQIRCGGRLRLVIGGTKPRGRMVIGALNIEPDVPIRADPAQEEADASQFLNPLLVLHAPLIDLLQRGFLPGFKLIRGVAIPQCEVHAMARPEIGELLT